jgi:hypothetical protein
MAAERELGKDQVPVHPYLKRTPGALDELDLRIGIPVPDFGRQTGGPRFVMSDHAVLNGDLHHCSAVLVHST